MCAGNKNKVNCQCDGNCDCGKVLPNGEISCDNCGWKAPQAYSSLTGNYTCPSCRTESSYSSNNNNLKNTKMDNSKNFTQGMVGLATVNPGFLNWSQDPLGGGNKNSESSFANNISSQDMVGYAIGQDWTVLNPFGKGGSESGYSELSDDDKKWAEIFYQKAAEFDVPDGEESGMFGDKLKNFVTRFTPTGILIRQSWSSKYCKALGYMRSADKNGFKKCMAATKINFQNAKSGKWKYPPAPEGIESDPDPALLAAQSAQEIASMTPQQKDALTNQAAGEDAQIAGLMDAKNAASTPTKNNTVMYIVIGSVILLAIIIAIIIIMRHRSQAKKS